MTDSINRRVKCGEIRASVIGKLFRIKEIFVDFFDAVKRRYSCRAYAERAVEADILERILEAARLAPSAKNLQDWRFVVVTDETTRQQLQVAANNQPFVGQAPVIIAACSNTSYRMRCGQSVSPIDVSIALEHIALAATALGLATCWIGSFFPDQVRQVLHIPTEIEIIDLMTLGYPADGQKKPKRLPMEQIVSREKWAF